MGTSSSASGPKSSEWTAAKSAATRLARGRTGATPRTVVRSGARALGGGAGTGAGGWTGGSATAAQRVGGLLAGASTDGLGETLQRVGIADLEGKPPGDALLSILDWVAADSTTLDDQAARRAAEQVLSALLESDDDVFDTPMDVSEAAELFRQFLVEYLTRTILTPLLKQLTENSGASQARRHERDIRRVVDALVHLELDANQFQRVDWFGDDGAKLVDRLRHDALDLLSAD